MEWNGDVKLNLISDQKKEKREREREREKEKENGNSFP